MALNLTQIATDLIAQAGYTGLSFGLFVDSFGIPIPSEVLVPLGTVLALDGRFSLWGVFLIGTFAQVAGGLVGKNMALMDQIAAKFSLVGILLVLGFLAWHFRRLWWRRGRD